MMKTFLENMVIERHHLYLFFCNRHRAINIFARTYYELWLQDENVGQEIMIEDLTVKSEINHTTVPIFKIFIIHGLFEIPANIRRRRVEEER